MPTKLFLSASTTSRRLGRDLGPRAFHLLAHSLNAGQHRSNLITGKALGFSLFLDDSSDTGFSGPLYAVQKRFTAPTGVLPNILSRLLGA
ncbi:hypothetical protein NMY22_g13154 [Coprinellus aureogranulatus]|nr:hypothetical protein NMY22_g13154 [Coprinellus aureogranulatus]